RYAGQVSGVFRAVNVIEDAIPDLPSTLRLRVEDVGPTGLPGGLQPATRAELFYDSQEGVFQPDGADLRQHGVSLAGRLWVVQVARSPVSWLTQ
ncbi:hypothetical protein, partial [Vibrio alginolyticus]|uniref:hypothetical protein n=1 Tax=Vibrio alginolyticus TaxID=663 RepID=UPI001A8D8E7D